MKGKARPPGAKKLAFSYPVPSFEGVTSPGPRILAQLFEWSFREVEQALPRLARTGYTHLQLSPVQKSLENGHWWGKYQPVDYRLIEGPLGTREDLMRLARATREHGLTLVVDVVLNHLAAAPFVRVERGRLREVDFPDFTVADFHPYAPIRDWSDERQVRNRWLFGGLPDLKTESPRVRTKLANHLRDLQCCGVGGFRLDSARHIPPADLAAILAEAGVAGLLVGEIADTSLATFAPYLSALPGVHYFDFPHLASLAACLRGERAMSSLLPENGAAPALPPQAAVRFLTNHDLVKGASSRSEGIRDERFHLPAAMHQLAETFLFGWGEGVPSVFVGEPGAGLYPPESPSLQAGISFFRRTHGLARQVWLSEEARLAWNLGDQACVFANRGGAFAGGCFPSTLPAGKYRDLLSGQMAEVAAGEIRLPLLAGARGYAFLRT
ncbi:alpha-amylase family glycosyl hydrolase [Roseibacillus ishigakijimensis]|uniref:Alpha-amylase n=1 Tax=Roseibacillus ishigakijimensis TaxID=454146 RepID=A0A934RMU7_9BACT|nr:alpha-amylase family glycosyl hydrolase [Roseibacillus ishigakijimensis]MBK1833708.1 hypothetical protein [Roseibacillus ishigakijimensis]